MKRLIAIPAQFFSCQVSIDKGRAWSSVDELILWAVHQQPQTIDEITVSGQLTRQLVVASLSRMMRFRLVDVSVSEGRACFATTQLGASFVGHPLPVFPKRIGRRVSFVVDRATGSLFRRRDVRLIPLSTLDKERQQNVDVRLVTVRDGAPPASVEANLQRLAVIAVRSHDEQLATVDGRTSSCRDDQVIAIDVTDGQISGIPKDAPSSFRGLIEQLARAPQRGDVALAYAGDVADVAASEPASVSSGVRPEDVLVGGEEHKAAFLALLSAAQRHVIVHSTFLSLDRFETLRESLRAACRRGVTVDVLWGADADDETASTNSRAASDIMAAIRNDMDFVGRFRVHMRSTGSHAKVVLADTSADGWLAVVGSCNWLLSPFRSVELSCIVRDPRAVALVARAMSKLLGKRGGAFDRLGTELALLATSLAQRPPLSDQLTGTLTLLEGAAHEEVARFASGAAREYMTFGSHRLGATARPGALLQAIAAAARGVKATVIYTRASGPIKNSDARALEDEMSQQRVRLVAASGQQLHGKFLAWDQDDVVVTSFNWASAAVDPAFPQSELGLHMSCSGLATNVLARLARKLPNLDLDNAARQ